MFYTLKIKAAFLLLPPPTHTPRCFYSENKQNPNNLHSAGKAGNTRVHGQW